MGSTTGLEGHKMTRGETDQGTRSGDGGFPFQRFFHLAASYISVFGCQSLLKTRMFRCFLSSFCYQLFFLGFSWDSPSKPLGPRPALQTAARREGLFDAGEAGG